MPALASGHAVVLDCTTDGLPAPTIEYGADFCLVDGEDARLRDTDPDIVCHLSNPQLRILTIGSDLTFTWEDTDDDRIFRGACTPR